MDFLDSYLRYIGFGAMPHTPRGNERAWLHVLIIPTYCFIFVSVAT